MLQAERASLRAVQVLFFLLLALVVLLASVWAGLVLSRQVTRPIAALSASARRVGAGDFDALVEVEGGDEIAALSTAFNAMTQELKLSRERLEAANADLAAANRRLDEERGRIRTVLAHLDAGVVAFGESTGGDGPGAARILALNDTARRLLGRATGSADPDLLCDLLGPKWLAPLGEFLCSAVGPSGPREAIVNLVPPGSAEPRVVEARIVHVPASPGGPTGWVVTLEDTTALVKAERAAAWEEAARRMAHEIKNPLTPIRLAAERMLKRARSAAAAGEDGSALFPVVEEGAATIVAEVRTLASLVDAFGHFARLPAPAPAPTDLGAIVRQVVTLYAGTKPGVEVSSTELDGLAPVRADAEMVKRALINLVDNAVAATPAGGHVTVEASVSDGTARLAVSDDGPGIPAAERGRVFDPSYSTKPRGTGLGLAITARIAAEHGGRVTVEENLPAGSRFVLEWPAT
jgi:two-component system nitrogen regulation sensor histidine kinase NtrY